MKLARQAGLLLAMIPFLAGCSGFWTPLPNSGSGSSGCTTNCTTASSGPFFILSNGTAPQVAGGTVVSGKLTAVSGSPWALTNAPYSMAISPNGAFLYVSTTLGVFGYPISNGILGTALQGSISSDDNAMAIQVDATGNWLIEALQAVGQVTMAAIPLNTITGNAAGIEVTTTYNVSNAAVQSRLAISPGNKNIFVPLGSGGVMVVPFVASVGSGLSPFGNATLIPVANAGASALSVAVDPSSRVFYVGEVGASPGASSGGLLAFDYSSLTGTLKQISGSPIASGGLAPNAILPDPAGNYVYVANGQGVGNAGNITSFSISASGSVYTIASGSTVATGTQPLSLAEDSSSQFIFDVGGVKNPHFDAFTFSSTTPGKLDSQFVAPAATSPLSILAAP